MLKSASMRVLAFAAAAAVAAPLLAAPADTIRARIAGFREIGTSFKAVNDSLRGTPNVALIQQSARQISTMARNVPNWFPAGTGPAPRLRTDAKPEIWSRPAEFRTKVDGFLAQAAAFDRAAQSGNVATIRAEARKLGATCKGCHDTFRQPDD